MTTFDDRELRAVLIDASRDAPRVDLWERIEPALGLPPARRRAVPRGLQAVAAILAVIVASGAMLAVFSLAGDTPETRRGRQLNTVPDLLLSQSWDQPANLHALLPATQEVRTLLDGVEMQGEPLVSQDGRQVLVSGWEVAGNTVTSAVYSFDSATMAFQWRAALVSEPIGRDGQRTFTNVALAGDRVYAASQRWLGDGPIALVALDRATGAQAGSWTLDVGDLGSNAPWLYASPDGTDLYALFDLWNGSGPNPVQAGVGYVHYALPDMREVARQVPLPEENLAYGWGGIPVNDGRVLASVGFFGQGQPPQVRFFDLAAGQSLPPLRLPFESASGLIQHAVSPDGTRLYLFDPTGGDLAIVDLESRTVVEHVVVDLSVARGDGGSLLGRLWGAVRGAFVQEAAAKVYINGSMQISPDGSRLYAVGVEGDVIGGEPTGVLVIDTRTWQVVERWLTDAHPVQVILGGDGRYLYVQTVSWGGDGVNEFRVVDTATGQDDLTVDLPTGMAWSLAELYRDTWGRAPVVAGIDGRKIAQAPAGEAVPFARLEVAVSIDSVVAGDPVTVEARFLDPTTGAVVRDGQSGVRFTPPDHVQATFSRGAGREKEVTAVLTQAQYGIYRGAALLPAAGTWSLDVTVRTSGEPLRRAGIAAAVVVQAALAGSDGNRYVLQITTDPTSPAANQPFTIRAAFVDVATGKPLTKGDGLLNGTPDEIAISLTPSNGSGVTTTTLGPTGDGSYAGTAKVWQADRWRIRADFPGDGVNGSTPAGVVEVE